jgi:hypothetical protein
VGADGWHHERPVNKQTSPAVDILDQLIALLDKPDDEAWGNVWSDEASNLFRRSHSDLLPQILAAWRQWPVHRQEHLGFILGAIGSNDEHLLITELLSSPNPSILSRAKEAQEEWAMSSPRLKQAHSRAA